MDRPKKASTSTRKTRFVCISDTHTACPSDGAFKLPKGDVLIHAGDLTNQGSLSELRKTLDWIEKADFELKIVIAGNHDVTLDRTFYHEYGSYFHNQNRESPAACLDMIQSSSIVYLHHSSANIRLGSPTGPHTTFTVFGSPYVPARGNWAFGYDHHSETVSHLWDDIPLNTDLVLTHTPAYNHCDASPKWGAAGCEGLRKALWRVRPQLAICGHIHEARGVERVKWKLDLPYVPYLEQSTEVWKDPGVGNKKQCLVDLTGRAGRPLDNDGALAQGVVDNIVSFTSPIVRHARLETTSPTISAMMRTSDFGSSVTANERLSRLHQRNIQALTGRLGRSETCIVNAAIMARSHGNGPKRYNKPIVVDLELPIWREEDIAEARGHTFSSRPSRGATTESFQSLRISTDDSSTSSITEEDTTSCMTDTDSNSSPSSSEESIYNHHFVP